MEYFVVENAWAKHLQRNYVMVLKNDKHFAGELTCRFKIDMRDLKNFDPSTQKYSKVSKIFTLIGFLSDKYMSFELKKCIALIFHDPEGWYKISKKLTWDFDGIPKEKMYKLEIYKRRGIDLFFQNWYEDLDGFWPKHLKVSKIYILMGPFWANYIMLVLNMYREVMFDSTKDWRKSWTKTDFYFQKWHEEFGKFSLFKK